MLIFQKLYSYSLQAILSKKSIVSRLLFRFYIYVYFFSIFAARLSTLVVTISNIQNSLLNFQWSKKSISFTMLRTFLFVSTILCQKITFKSFLWFINLVEILCKCTLLRQFLQFPNSCSYNSTVIFISKF